MFCPGGSRESKPRKEACQSGRMGLTANELSPLQGPEVQILSPPPRWCSVTVERKLNTPAPVAQRIEHLTTDQKVRGSNPSGAQQKIPLVEYGEGIFLFQSISPRAGASATP